MAFLTDTFTETSDTAGTSHTSDSGHTYTDVLRTMVVIGSEDRVRGDSSSATSAMVSSATPASNEYDVEAEILRTTSDPYPLPGVWARYDAGANAYIQAYMNHGTNQLSLEEVNGGTVSEGNYGSQTWAVDTPYALKLVIRNGTNGVKAYIGGTLKAQLTGDVATAIGKVGVRSRLYGRVDSLVATDYSTGVTLDCTVGNAVAAGAQANISAGTTINASVGNAAAAGAQANISAGTTINASVGNAVAEGAQASITSGTTLDCTVGNAVAAGAQATISAGTTINAGVGNAVAAGVQASITTGFTLECTVGNAVAAGVQAGISIGSGTVTIACAVGNAVAAGVDVDIWSADPLLPRSRRIGGEILQAADDDVVARAPSRRIGGSVLRKPA